MESSSDGVNRVFASRWIGSAWSPIGGAVNRDQSMSAYEPAVAFASDGSLICALFESMGGAYESLRVVRWDGSAWPAVGAGNINVSPVARMGRPRIAVDGVLIYVSWWETVSTGGPSVSYAALFDGSSWAVLGGALNSSLLRSSTRPFICILSGTPYVALEEEDSSGVKQLALKRWNGAAWDLVAGSLNRSASFTAQAPWLVAGPDGRLYIAWFELGPSGNNAVYVKAFDGTSFSDIGGALNAYPGGDAYFPSIAFSGQGILHAAWGERMTPSARRHAFASKWTGTGWSLAGGILNHNPERSSYQGAVLTFPGDGVPLAAWPEDSDAGSNTVIRVKRMK
jgi:hypothetical protein